MILGINTSHDSAFCLLDDEGRPLYVLEEERFNRIKHTGFSTFIALETLIRDGLLNPAKVSDLVYSFEMEDDLSAKLMNRCYENVVSAFGESVFEEASRYFHQPEHSFSPTRGLGLQINYDEALLRLRALFPNAREASYMHHLCHAASAFYPSPFASAAVVILDGAGRLETTTVWRANDAGLALLHEIDLPHSMGILYWLFSQYLSLEEGQTMGLAAYGQPVYEKLLYDRVIAIDREGRLAFKAPIVSWFDMDNEYAVRIIENLFGVKARRSHEPLTQFHADVAASIQRVTEEALLAIASHARHLTGEANLCLAGGVIQNCVANGHLVCAGVFDRVWIQPMANDGGTALGAALHHHYAKRPDRRQSRWRMTTAKLGLGYDGPYVESYLERMNVPYRKSKAPAQEAARSIVDGKVVGWVQGSAEVGPRALGGRSILADARSKFNQFTVNDIKLRQPWRPFAPAILQQHMKDYFESAHASPYMILSFPLVSEARAKVPAICHVDGTARVQTVSDDDGAYYDLLVRLYEMTGIPIMLNTSFNLKAEPIVQHPLEAIRDFLISGMDLLVMGDLVIAQKPTLQPLLLEALNASRFVSLYDDYLRDARDLIFIKHDRLSPSKSRRRSHLQAILTWLSIPFREIRPHELADDAAASDSEVTLLSVAPLLDAEVLRTLPQSLLEKVWLSVMDNRMFPAQTTASDLLEIINANRRELHRLTQERPVAVWADGDDLDEIVQGLRSLGIEASEVLSTNGPRLEKIKQGDVFLVTSFSIMDEFKSELREMGYHSGRGYLVWDTEQ